MNSIPRCSTMIFPSKPCIKCGSKKPLSEFYKHARMADGRLNKCKECCKNYGALRRLRSDRPREIDKARYKAGKRKNSSPAWRKQNPEKYRAQTTVNNAIRDGKLVRQPCRVCGEKAHAHHPDYSKPLEVDRLCARHHSWEHNDVV